jgi:LmbE family N-acetylglucosaminyl deacetylase
MNNILIVAAHLDDVELGMGGTVLKLTANKNNRVYVVMMCNGDVPNRPAIHHDRRHTTFLKNIKSMDVVDVYDFDYPSNQLQTIDSNDIVHKIDTVIAEIQPTVVYTHNRNDINRDHRIVSEAVRVCTRPRITSPVDALYEFPIPGSTEWNYSAITYNVVEDITLYHDKKLELFGRYDTEIRSFPDPMSLEKIKSRDEYYGSIYGYDKAEVFKLIFMRRR